VNELSRTKREILLVEPDYKNKYPPLGLMKIASYHRLRGDCVRFVKGLSPDARAKQWDRIYITTLFTFYWNKTVQTIRYYAKSSATPQNVFVGGILATLMKEELEKELSPTLDVTIIQGLLDHRKIVDDDSNCIIENLIPNYSILGDVNYKYGMADGYLGYSTRGCVNNCGFCAVRTLEPQPKYRCQRHASIVELVRTIDELYGPKRDLLLLDNNILASPDFKEIIKDILAAGFEKGATQNNKLRRLDFNQGLDARLLNVTKTKLLAETAINPIRLAFDHSKMRKSYEKAVRLTCKYGMTKQSTYVLFNYNDTPEDFYSRLEFNLQLNKELDAKISSFPMKYIPLNAKTRSFIGKHWHRKMIRGVQCILLATKGMVSPNPVFFYRAFGKDERRFREICMMPEHYIIWREKNEQRAQEWLKLYRAMSQNQINKLLAVLARGKIKKSDCIKHSGRLKKLMEHYIEPE
jgi:hypothetical protein